MAAAVTTGVSSSSTTGLVVRNFICLFDDIDDKAKETTKKAK